MNNNDKFIIATIGIDEKQTEMNVVNSVLIISQTRTPKFEFHDTSEKKKIPSVVIVNADNPDAIGRWHAYHDLHKDKHKISSIMIGKEKPDEAEFFLGRPLMATRLLALLEKIVTEEHGYEPASAFEDSVPEEKKETTEQTVKSRIDNDISALVVDDSLPIRTQLKIALQGIANKVDFAENGNDAMELIEKNNYSIVFLDVILPGIDGYDVCKKIKHDLGKKDMPVIMLTSNSSPADRVKGKLAGCDTYLIKPVQHAVFEEVVQECLSTSSEA